MAKFAKIAVLLFIAILSTTAYASIVVRQYPDVPSALPTDVPSALPTDVPSGVPTDVPSALPSDPSGGDEAPSPSGSVPTPIPTPSVPIPSVPAGAVPSGSVIPGFSSLIGKYSTDGPSSAPTYVPSSTPQKTPATTPNANAAHKIEASLISGIIIIGFAGLFF